MTRLLIPAVLTLSAVASAQAPKAQAPSTQVPAPKQTYGRLEFQTKVGSFKLLGGGDAPAEGTLEFSFSGSVLVSELKGVVETTGNVRLEHQVKDFNKRVYFGTGTIRIRGQFRAVQWFGRNMKGTFNGWGIVRLYGEFDSNLETGTYRYAGEEIQDWGTGGRQVAVPKPADFSRPVPKIKRTGG